MRYLAVMFSLMLLVGCSKVTKENYDQLKSGMSQAEVEAVLGSSDMCTETFGTKTCSWGNEDRNITINFVGDTVLVLSNKGL